MVLEGYRRRLAPYLERISRPYLAYSPNTLSWLAFGLLVAAAVLAALVRWTTPLLFLPVAGLILVGGAFDVIDGEVARRTNRASLRGNFLDHVLDRYADMILVIGIAVSGFANPILALLALASLLLTSYMGTQAEAVGQGRLYGGLLTRADRLVLLCLAAFLEFLWTLPWPWAPSMPWAHFSLYGFSFTVIDVVFVYFIVAGQWTAFSRARRTYARLPPPPT
ncbi:MAG: CDP-alcohol phosphatidyltransferase family protein [Candidatus Thermoplasmatota archaeon]|jgi:archaetidylinositol phosphate synthase|nr:CDP-alcohol phosphatidyltransferase family protein [Candidatus Thermoplasmatota archaeon]